MNEGSGVGRSEGDLREVLAQRIHDFYDRSVRSGLLIHVSELVPGALQDLEVDLIAEVLRGPRLAREPHLLEAGDLKFEVLLGVATIHPCEQVTLHDQATRPVFLQRHRLYQHQIVEYQLSRAGQSGRGYSRSRGLGPGTSCHQGSDDRLQDAILLEVEKISDGEVERRV